MGYLLEKFFKKLKPSLEYIRNTIYEYTIYNAGINSATLKVLVLQRFSIGYLLAVLIV